MLVVGAQCHPVGVELAMLPVTAQEQHATLVRAFIGHGWLRGRRLLPDSREAVLVGQRIKELLRRYSVLDELVLLIGACHSGLEVESNSTSRRSQPPYEIVVGPA
jgi:hypothetical protein